jgi:peptidoglycan hydrolase-like protein with peptidoglycan-binding domain
MGLYNGSLDGVIGRETKQALLAFQESNGLERTAGLDQQTADALIGNTGVGGVGSSMPPKGRWNWIREQFRQPHGAKIDPGARWNSAPIRLRPEET